MGTVRQSLPVAIFWATAVFAAGSAAFAGTATQPGMAASTGGLHAGLRASAGSWADGSSAFTTDSAVYGGSAGDEGPVASAGSRADGGSRTNGGSASNIGSAVPGAAPGDEGGAATRASRWQALQKALFPGRSLQDGAGIVKLDAPPRALDAALVPISIDLSAVKPIKGVYVVIDDNPSPLAAHFTFGPKADPHTLKLRVRVDQYTNMHAVAETQDGHLFVATRFVKASGGCSAPAGPDDAAALADIGRMKLHLIGEFAAGKPEQAVLMVRHPNFNGMQMNQITRYYTPARFIRTIDATYEGGSIFHLDSDISMSTDPVITFGFVPQGKGQLQVVVRDSKEATFDHSFDVPGNGNTVANTGAPGA
jgi:sulfur-oxidizing protein SoxY